MSLFLPSERLILLILVLMGALANFASDNYLPSLPAIAQSMAVPNNLVRLSISIYLLGLAGSALIYGPLSDSYGRRPILFIGYSIFIIGCVLATFSRHIEPLLFARFIQGCGIGAGATIFRAIIRDIFAGPALAKASSILSIALALAPPLAPITGGYLQTAFGWQANFIFLTLLGLSAILLFWVYLPETHAITARDSLSFRQSLAHYTKLIQYPRFIGYALSSSLALANILIYITITPFIFLHVLHLSPIEYGWLSPCYAFSYLIGASFNFKLLRYYSATQLLFVASKFMLVASIAMMYLGFSHYITLPAILIPMMAIAFSNSFVFSNASALAFEDCPNMAGTAGALFSGLQLLVSGGCSGIAAWLPAHNQGFLGLMLCITTLGLNVLSYWAGKTRL